MATLSSPGIGSGLDINGIVSQLMALERRPLDLIQKDTTKYNTQLSSYGRLQSSMSALRDAAAKLADPSSWNSTSISSSDAAGVSATLSSTNGSSPAASYSVVVSKLAGAQTLSSATTFASSAASVGSGTLTIELGRWTDDQTGFTPKDGVEAKTITIASGSDSLAAVRDAINAAGAGVAASIVNDANGARLVVRSTTTGAENGFRIAVSDDDGNGNDLSGLSRLAYDPRDAAVDGNGAPLNPAPGRMTRTMSAVNAELTINGVAVSSASNTLTDVLDGLTLKVTRVSTDPVELGVTRDAAATKKMVTDFSTAYNDMVKLLRSQTSYDDTTKAAGALQGDRAAVGLLNSMRSLVSGLAPAVTGFSRLSDIGLEPQRDGTLKVDDGKLDSAVSRFAELKAFLTRDEAGTANDGVGVLLRSFADQTTGSEGVLSTRQQALRDRIKRNGDSSDRFEQRLALVEKRLRDTYTRMDTNMSNLSSLQNYVGQQITNWNKQNY